MYLISFFLGTNGSQLWDAAFISQALVETGLGSLPQNQDSTHKLLKWLDDCQIRENPKYYEEAYRHATKGAWPFSTKEQGYTVSDCAAEGMKAVLLLQSLPFVFLSKAGIEVVADERLVTSDSPQLVSYERLCDCVDVILSLQNPTGGFASCTYQISGVSYSC